MRKIRSCFAILLFSFFFLIPLHSESLSFDFYNTLSVNNVSHPYPISAGAGVSLDMDMWGLEGAFKFEQGRASLFTGGSYICDFGKGFGMNLTGFVAPSFWYGTGNNVDTGIEGRFYWTGLSDDCFTVFLDLGLAFSVSRVKYQKGTETVYSSPEVNKIYIAGIGVNYTFLDMNTIFWDFTSWEKFRCNFGLAPNMELGYSRSLIIPKGEIEIYFKSKFDFSATFTNYGRPESIDFTLGGIYTLPKGRM